MGNDGNEIDMIFFFSLGSQCGAGSVCITAFHGTNKVEFMCMHFASKLKRGSEKIDVLSQVDNRKEYTTDIGCCCWKWILRPEVGSACGLGQVPFVWGWMGGRERLMLEPPLCYLLLIFPFFDRKKHAQRMGELLRVPWQKPICFGRTEIISARLFLFLLPFNYVAPVCSLHFLLVSHVFVQGNL